MNRAQYESVEVPYALAGSPDEYNRGKMQVYTLKIKEYFEKHNEEEIMFHTYNLEHFPHVMTIEELAEFMDRNCYVLPDDNGSGEKMKKKGSKGAPTAKNFARAKMTVKKKFT